LCRHGAVFEYLLKQPSMALAEKGRRNGWQHQATGLVASHATLPATAKTAVDRGGALLNRRNALRPGGDTGAKALAQTIDRTCP
jgi:hypothetical protein